MRLLIDKIRNIALEIRTGKTPPTSNPEYFGEEINWYTPSDLDKVKFLGKSRRGITAKAIADKKAIVYKPNTVLIGAIGDIGKLGVTSILSSSNQQITGIYPDPKKLEAQYLYYWLKAHKQLLLDKSKSALVPILNNKDLGEIKISFPDNIPDQLHIAYLLSKAETLITQRKETLRLLDENLKSTFLEMFGDLVSNSKNWEVHKLVDLLAKPTMNGLYVPKENYNIIGIEMVHMSDLFYDIVKRGNIKRVLISNKEIEKYGVDNNDLLIARRSLNFEGAARACLIPPSPEPLVFESSMIRVRPYKNKILPVYLFFYFNFLEIKKRYIYKYITKSTISGINQANLNKVEIVTPSIELQTQFAQIVEKTEALKNQYQQSLHELENLYNTLSQKAFRGQLSR